MAKQRQKQKPKETENAPQQQKQVNFEDLTLEQKIEVLEKQRVEAEQRAWYFKGRVDTYREQLQEQEKSNQPEKELDD